MTDAPLPYFPRPALLRSVLAALSLGRPIALFAPRRQGKTMFVLNELIPAMDTRRWRVAYVDLWMRRSQPELAMVEGLEASASGKKLWLTRPYRITKLTAKGKLTIFEAGAEAEPVAAPAVSADDLVKRLEVAMEKLTRRGVVLLVFDEFQALAQTKNEDFVAAFRALLQRHEEAVRVFYTGSSRDALNSMFNRQHAPLFRSATSIPLPELQPDFTKERAALMRQRGLRVNAAALDKLFDRLYRTPEFLNGVIAQMVMRHDPDLEHGFRAWYENDLVGNNVQAVLDKLRPIHMAVLNLLVQEPGRPMFTADVAEMVADTTHQQVSPSKIQTALKTLTKRGLVAPTGGPGCYEMEDRALLVFLHEQPTA